MCGSPSQPAHLLKAGVTVSSPVECGPRSPWAPWGSAGVRGVWSAYMLPAARRPRLVLAAGPALSLPRSPAM